MAIAFRAAASAGTANPGTSLVITKPTGTVDGDVMIAGIVGNITTELVAPAGWTQVRLDSASTFRYGVYRRVASSEGANYTWTLTASGTGSIAGGIQAYSGVDNTTPVDIDGGQTNASSTSIVAPSVTTTVADTRLVGFFQHVDPAGAVTPDAGQTERFEVSPDAFTTAEGGDEAVVAIGATGSRTATAANAAANCGQLIALRPAATAGCLTLLLGIG